MKKTIYLLFLILPSLLYSLDAIDLNGTYRESSGNIYKKLIIKDSYLTYEDKNYQLENPVVESISHQKFTLENDSGLTYIAISNRSRWMIIYSDGFILLYDSDGRPFFYGEKIGGGFITERLNIFNKSTFSSDKYLTESLNGEVVEYGSENLTNNAEIPFPWVEGESDYGVGVTLHGNVRRNDLIGASFLLFSNGYVSYSRPDLFGKNSRVKKLLIKNVSTDAKIIFDIDDTPHFQLLDITSLLESERNNIEIEILDIYKGTLYKDTCINFLSTYDIRAK